MATSNARPIRIGSCSGSVSDRRHLMLSLAQQYPNDPVDVIVGDWLSEANMTVSAGRKLNQKPAKSAPGYEEGFLRALAPALPFIAKHKIKLIANAGGSDTEKLTKKVLELVAAKGFRLKVAWIEGDEVLSTVRDMQRKGSKFTNICTGQDLEAWDFEPIYAQCYLGGLGIAAALENGADIVICGRVSDASPVIGAAFWWHKWKRSDLDYLANAFVAGHLVECSTYVCGGNFSGFKSLEGKSWLDIGCPIAEIGARGEVIITKQQGSGGMLSVGTCTGQLLYEIQGPWYYNSDVTAVLDQLAFEQVSSNRVALRGVRGLPPPPTTKVGLTAFGGYQAEMHWFLVGLDIAAKARMLEDQIRHAMGSRVDNLSVLKFSIAGTPTHDPPNQNSATVDFRVFAQARSADALSAKNFGGLISDLTMITYPGATFNLDVRQAVPKGPIFEYFVTLLSQGEVRHTAHLPGGEKLSIPPPSKTQTFPTQQPSQPETAAGIELASFGETSYSPLGLVVHARSGDKGSNANVGFWVRHRDEWDWLRTLLSTSKIRSLLGEEYRGGRIDRFELPNICAVHFLLHDHLDRGVSCTSTYDFLGKNVAEYLRSKCVAIPTRFLARGRL